MLKHRCILTLTLALALFVLACSSEEAPPQRQVSERLLEETSDVFVRTDVADWEEVFAWTFQNAEDLEPWHQEGFDLAAQLTKGYWLLGASGPGAFVERPASFSDAVFHSDSVDRIEVVFEGLRRRALTLRWTQPDEPFGPERILDARDSKNTGRYVFDLASNTDWQGDIAQLRFQPSMRPKLRGRLVSIRGLRSVVSTDLRQQASQRSYKVALDQTSRTARLVAPGIPFVETVTVTAAQQLEVAFGLDLHAPGDATFRIEAVVDDAAEGGQAETPSAPTPSASTPSATTLFTSTVSGSDQWQRASIDLAAWTGQSLELRFLVDNADPQIDDDMVYGFWGDLKLSRPHDAEPLPNVVMVVVDTLRADHLSLYGYHRPTTPHLERWAAKEAVTFRSVVAASAWTFPSHVSLFTGLDALSHGQLYAHPMPPRFDLLAQKLQRAGYETMAVTGGGFLDAHYGFARGFDRYFVVPTLLSDNGDLEEGLERAKQWTEEAHRPYFLFFHTYEVHGPFRAREPYYQQFSGREGNSNRLARLTRQQMPLGDTAGAVRRETFAWRDGRGGMQDLAEGDVQDVIDAYDSAIAYTDDHLSRFFEELSSRNEEDLIIVTSDHGEALGEHQLAGHSYLYDFNLKIPLLIALPDGRGAGRMVEEQVRQIDVAPTLLEALGLAVPAMDGTSLLPFFGPASTRRSPEDNLAWSATGPQGLALRRGNRLKYVFNNSLWQRQEAREALFILDNDPDEEHNRASEHEATEDLQRLAIARFMESANGLIVALHNPTAQARQVTFECPTWLGAQFIRSVDAPPQSLDFDDPPFLRIQVPAGGRFSVVLDQVTPNDVMPVEVEGELGSCSFLLDTVDGASPVEGILQRRFDGSCREIGTESVTESATKSNNALSMSLLYRNAVSVSGTDVADEMPAALTDQLRALGYLD